MNWLTGLVLGIFILLGGMSIERANMTHHFSEKLVQINQIHQEELIQVVPLSVHERIVNENTRFRINTLYGGLYSGKLEHDIDQLRNVIRQLRRENLICENRSA